MISDCLIIIWMEIRGVGYIFVIMRSLFCRHCAALCAVGRNEFLDQYTHVQP